MSAQPLGDDADAVDLGAEDALELNLEEPEPERRRSRQIWYAVLAGFTGLALGVLLAFWYIASSSKDQRAATCAVIATNRQEKQAQLEQYDQNPPTSELGVQLRETYKESLHAWDGLWSTLGCKEAPVPAP